MSPAIKTRPLEPFGREVLGIDMAAEHDEPTIAALRRLWAENGLLLFRGQHLEETDLVRFSGRFGALEIHVREEYLSPSHPEVLMVSNIRRNGRAIGILSDREVGWHHDQIYLERPALGSLLYAVQLPRWGGNTLFANLERAYAALPQATRERLEGRRAVQSYEHFNARYSEPTNAKQRARTPDIAHPAVRTHPETGRKALYMDPAMTVRIEGLPEAESRALLDELFGWMVREEFVHEHQWRPGDALMWDNASTMHRRGEFDPDSERLMKRTTILAPEDRAIPV